MSNVRRPLATLEIVHWREDAVGFAGWDSHARAELTKRLRRAMNTSPGEVRSIVKRVLSRQVFAMHGVHEESIASIRQILESMGADVTAALE